MDGNPSDGCLEDGNPFDASVPFCRGNGEGIVDFDWPGIRIARPQYEQGPLLTSHSLPQRGQIMLYPSLKSAWNNLQEVIVPQSSIVACPIIYLDAVMLKNIAAIATVLKG